MAAKARWYELRAFVISGFAEPEVLSEVKSSEVEISSAGSSGSY